MEPQHLKSVLESLLFVSNKPLKLKDLAGFLQQPESDIRTALESLAAERRDSGVVVLDNDGEYQLATNSANSTQVKNFLNAELREKLTDATVEVLAIIAYRQPISKAEIEAIRGVNSQYSLRNLLMRGLVEKIPNPHDARGFLYQTTTEFLQHLGLASVKELPEFEKLVSDIKLPQTVQMQQEQGQPIAETEHTALTEEAAQQTEPRAGIDDSKELSPIVGSAIDNTSAQDMLQNPVPTDKPAVSAHPTVQNDLLEKDNEEEYDDEGEENEIK